MSIEYTREYIYADTKTKSKKKDLKNDNDVVDKAGRRGKIFKSMHTRIKDRMRGSLMDKKVKFAASKTNISWQKQSRASYFEKYMYKKRKYPYKKYGVFPLKGKLLNVREATASQLVHNEEIKNIKKIMGLKQKIKIRVK